MGWPAKHTSCNKSKFMEAGFVPKKTRKAVTNEVAQNEILDHVGEDPTQGPEN